MSDQVCFPAPYDPCCSCEAVWIPAAKGFYVNGICNQPKGAWAAADKIQTIVSKSVGLNFCVEPHYNGSCTDLSCVARLGQVQADKQALAAALVQKIRQAIYCEKYGRIALFAHSQGADVVGLALCQLRCEELCRVAVVTLGPKSTLKGAANFQNPKDWISRLANLFSFFAPGKVSSLASNGACTTTMCHGVDDYLAHREVQEAIVAAATSLSIRLRSAIDLEPKLEVCLLEPSPRIARPTQYLR